MENKSGKSLFGRIGGDVTIKAIETVYKGYRFRSRLEARWAVYLDAIGLQWEYEKEGFDLDGVRYLPDFWLPQVRMWAEVKPEAFSESDLRKAALLAWKSRRSVILLEGTPSVRPYDYLCYGDCNTWGEIGCDIGIVVGDDEGMIFRQDCVISMYHGYPISQNRFFCATGWSAEEFEEDANDMGFGDVVHAVQKARSARFEHGETPRT